MALVIPLEQALFAESLPEPMLLRAAAPGRVQTFALEHGQALRDDPRYALSLPKVLRKARHLQSRERRLVSDLLYDLLRWRGLFRWALGTDALPAHVLAWLTTRGLAHGAHPELPLRRVSSAAELAAGLSELPADQALHIVLGGSQAFTHAVHRSLGDAALAFALASQQRGPTVLRAHAGRGGRDGVAESLRAEGIDVEPTRWSRHGLRVLKRANLLGSATYREGRFEVQAEGSQIIAEVVDTRAKTVLDLCAGAGGKSLAIHAEGRAHVSAADVRGPALDELRKRANRAGSHVQTTKLGNRGELTDTLAERRFDAVLVDAPCSGSGTLRGQPHLRYSPSSRLGGFAPVQRAILERAATLVAPRGQLIYATCSVLQPENDAIVDAFLAKHRGFELEPMSNQLGARADELGGERLRMLPHTHGGDGFYAVSLRRS